MADYKNRIADELLDIKLQVFGATLIEGPKGCGKTTTARQKAKSIVEFQDEDKRDNYLLVANTMPSKLLVGEKPRLFDEWQDAPKIWGAIRKYVDDSGEKGQFILTGSSSQIVDTPHTGTMRISSMTMYPMSLYESGESNGSVSLADLFDNPQSFDSCKSNMSIDDIIFAICRGGWPASILSTSKRYQLEVAKDLYNQTYKIDISNIDKTKRNPKLARAILRSYARNICTLCESKTIYQDVKSTIDISDKTISEYISALEKLYIIDDVTAWCPAIRSKSAIRASVKRNFVDPSVAVAALGLNPDYFNTDFKTLGFLFESLCIRDLKVYSTLLGGEISYYHDRYGLEADCVLHLANGKYAIIEFKLGASEIELAAKHLCEMERLIAEYNKKANQCPLRMPDLKIIITATEYGFRRDDGVLVIPIGCLKN